MTKIVLLVFLRHGVYCHRDLFCVNLVIRWRIAVYYTDLLLCLFD